MIAFHNWFTIYYLLKTGMKQTKIIFFPPSEGATNEPKSENITDQTDPEKQHSDENNNTAPPTSTELTKKVVKCNFREKWLSMYPWLEYDSEKQLMTLIIRYKLRYID